MMMKRLMSVWLCSLALLAPLPAAAAAACKASDWPLWELFKKHFVQDSGRVLDASTKMQHSSSEGQSYGMFFALVAGDDKTFDAIWRWSVDNLAGGDMSQRLPAWIWGVDDDKNWRVLDANSASDGDLWFAYALLEAGRLWSRPDYTRSAHALLRLIEAQEVLDVPGLGRMLLPGKEGFVTPGKEWRFNPSYLPIPLLRRLELEFPAGPWKEIAGNTAKMLARVTPYGLAPDWTAYRAQDGGNGAFGPDPAKGAEGSYDAIRNYLWAGMTPMADPLFRAMMISLDGMAFLTRDKGAPPEKVDTLTGRATGEGPFGFSAALVPYFKASGEPAPAQLQKQRAESMLRASLAKEGVQPPYYDFVLSLFGLGWVDQYYDFRPDGTLSLPWEKACLDIPAN
ncbi:cellulose synthase complex periplasmic endoglucanase BcsZ [Parapusillimonas granuli]|nr:cellulose synthase complex periplasmic endoglucanase BcsZ [Parapusillimonas granuli]MBB5216315.1 endoglucanase [Parapusillimonas granuli]MEB2401674.1 cellulose synthase complex periplasmic endoglucanase BcsZ [Alcaligenaceae bacterium]